MLYYSVVELEAHNHICLGAQGDVEHALAAVGLCERGEVGLVEREVENVEVLGDMSLVCAAGDSREAGLQLPAEQYLRAGLAVLFGYLLHLGQAQLRLPAGYQSVIILKEESDRQVLTVNPPVGSSSDCYCSSVGKCLLAFSPDIDLSVYDSIPMHSYTEHTITTVPALRAELNTVRERGYAMDHEELEQGLTCIGAPILDHSGYAIAAISISGPSSRMLNGDIEERIEAVRRAAKEVSMNF